MTNRIYRSRMKVDEPTPNKGLIFPKIMLEGAIETYLVRENFIGMLEDESDVDKYDVNPSKVSHWVDNLYIDSEGYLCASIRFLDTPAGKMAENMADELLLTLVFFVTPDWDDKTLITSCEVQHINLRPQNLLISA